MHLKMVKMENVMLFIFYHNIIIKRRVTISAEIKIFNKSLEAIDYPNISNFILITAIVITNILEGFSFPSFFRKGRQGFCKHAD